MREYLRRFIRDDGGAAGVEYGILVAAVSAAIVAAAFTLGGDIGNAFDFTRAAIEAACTSPCGTAAP